MLLTWLLGMWEPGGRVRDELPQLCSRPWSSLNLTVGTFLEIWLKTKRKDQVAQASSAWAHWRYPHLQKQRGFKGALETLNRSGGWQCGVVWVGSCYPDPEPIPRMG